MSLIFEALKKLDREKKAPDRGFLVVGGAPVAGERRLRVPALLLLLAAAGGGGFLIARTTRLAPPVAVALPPVPSTAAPAVVPRLLPPAPLPPETAERPALSERPPAAEPQASVVAPAPPVPQAQAPAQATPAFALQAVADQDGQPVAIVNGQLVRVGDLVGGARVLRIEREEVELEQGGRRLVLTF